MPGTEYNAGAHRVRFNQGLVSISKAWTTCTQVNMWCHQSSYRFPGLRRPRFAGAVVLRIKEAFQLKAQTIRIGFIADSGVERQAGNLFVKLIDELLHTRTAGFVIQKKVIIQCLYKPIELFTK